MSKGKIAKIDDWKLKVAREASELTNLVLIEPEDAQLLQINRTAPLKEEVAARLRILADELKP